MSNLVNVASTFGKPNELAFKLNLRDKLHIFF